RLVADTSPSAGDGKTLTSINLAGVLSRGSDARVLLIDADLRRPEIAARLGLSTGDSRGLVDAVTDEAITLDDVPHRLDGFNLSVITARIQPRHAAALRLLQLVVLRLLRYLSGGGVAPPRTLG